MIVEALPTEKEFHYLFGGFRPVFALVLGSFKSPIKHGTKKPLLFRSGTIKLQFYLIWLTNHLRQQSVALGKKHGAGGRGATGFVQYVTAQALYRSGAQAKFIGNLGGSLLAA